MADMEFQKPIEFEKYMLAGDRLAEGPEGLYAALSALSKEKDPLKEGLQESDSKSSYIFYKHNEQQSLIKVDLSKEGEYQFWYADLEGRRATDGVKKAIAKFLLFPNGGQELPEAELSYINDNYDKITKNHFHDLYYILRREKVEATIEGKTYDIYSYHNPDYKRNSLEFAIKTNAWKKLEEPQMTILPAKVLLSQSKDTLFASKGKAEHNTEAIKEQEKIPPKPNSPKA